MLLQLALLHSFLWLSNIPVCVCVCVPHLYSFVDGHLDRVHVLAIVNDATVNIAGHVSFWSVLYGYMARIGIAGS